MDGKTLYEAAVKDKNGNVSDLEVTEDGKLVKIKLDDAAGGDRSRPKMIPGTFKVLVYGMK